MSYILISIACFTGSLIVMYTQGISCSLDIRLLLDFIKIHIVVAVSLDRHRCHMLRLVASYRKILQIHAAVKKRRYYAAGLSMTANLTDYRSLLYRLLL